MSKQITVNRFKKDRSISINVVLLNKKNDYGLLMVKYLVFSIFMWEACVVLQTRSQMC